MNFAKEIMEKTGEVELELKEMEHRDGECEEYGKQQKGIAKS